MARYYNTSLDTYGDISQNTYVFSNAGGYLVQTNRGNITNNIISFGNGAWDVVMTRDPDGINNGYNTGIISGNKIQFGTGIANSVGGYGLIKNNSIVFGNGSWNEVGSHTGVINNKIYFGSGAEDSVGSAGIISNNIINFGNGFNNAVSSTTMTNNTITFGNGNQNHIDCHSDDFGHSGETANNTIRFGNGAGDYLTAALDGGNNKIIMGNGAGDYITFGPGAGGNTFITGTGADDRITVGAHTNPDTFGFSLQTNGSHYTTVSGAQAADHVILSSNNLANTIVQASTTKTTIAAYISSLPLQSGKTYVGYNGTDTFIVTDVANKIGAIDIVGNFSHNSISGHILTLG